MDSKSSDNQPQARNSFCDFEISIPTHFEKLGISGCTTHQEYESELEKSKEYEDNSAVEDHPPETYNPSDSEAATEDSSMFGTEGSDRHNTSCGDKDEFNTTLDDIERLLNGQQIFKVEEYGSSAPVNNTSTTPTSRIPIAIPKSKSPVHCFKVPQVSTKKLATPKLGNCNLKNIISPVGLYIKHSPQSSLVKNVHLPTNSNITPIAMPKKVSTHTFNSLPETIYIPAKSQIITSRKNLFLPPSIEKLVKEPQKTKHEGRLNNHVDQKEVERLLATETDLTFISGNTSTLNDTNVDVSVLVTKNALR